MHHIRPPGRCVAAHSHAESRSVSLPVLNAPPLPQLSAAQGLTKIAFQNEMSFVVSAGGNFLETGLPGAPRHRKALRLPG